MTIEVRNNLARTHNGSCKVQEKFICILGAEGRLPPFSPRLIQDIIIYCTAQLGALCNFMMNLFLGRKRTEETCYVDTTEHE